jgi:hypothetical protein
MNNYFSEEVTGLLLISHRTMFSILAAVIGLEENTETF